MSDSFTPNIPPAGSSGEPGGKSKPTQNAALSFELTAWIDDVAGGTEYGPPTEESVLAMAAALRAVIELHTPDDSGHCAECIIGHDGDSFAAGALVRGAWPCPTITAITNAIGA